MERAEISGKTLGCKASVYHNHVVKNDMLIIQVTGGEEHPDRVVAWIKMWWDKDGELNTIGDGLQIA